MLDYDDIAVLVMCAAVAMVVVILAWDKMT
jgi:hypothetical protein